MEQEEFSIIEINKADIVNSLMIHLDTDILEDRNIPIEKAVTSFHVEMIADKMIDILMHDTPATEAFWNMFGEFLDDAVFATIYEEFNQ